nr:hypothetical protein [bacterium]
MSLFVADEEEAFEEASASRAACEIRTVSAIFAGDAVGVCRAAGERAAVLAKRTAEVDWTIMTCLRFQMPLTNAMSMPTRDRKVAIVMPNVML